MRELFIHKIPLAKIVDLPHMWVQQLITAVPWQIAYTYYIAREPAEPHYLQLDIVKTQP